MSNFACNWPWLFGGLLGGWLLWQLFDKMFRRDGETAGIKARRDLEAANARVGTLQGELTTTSDRFRAELADATTSLKAKTDESATFLADVDQWKTKHSALEGKLSLETAAAAAAATAAAAALAVEHEKYGTLKAELETSAASLQARTADLERVRAELAECKTKHAAVKDELDTATVAAVTAATGAAAALKAASEGHAKLQAELASANDALARARSEHATFVAGHDTLKAEHATTVAGWNTLKAEHATFVSAHDTLKAQHAAAMAGWDKLKAEHATFVSAHDTLKSQHAAAITGWDKLKAEHAASLDAHGKVRVELASVSDGHGKVKAELALAAAALLAANDGQGKLRAELAAAQAETSKVRGELSGATDATARVRAELAATNDAAARLRSELAAAKASLGTESEAHGRTKAELQAARDRQAALQAERDTVRTSLAAKADEASTLGRELAECRTKHDTLSAEMSRASASAATAQAFAAAAEHGFTPRRNGRDDLLIIEGIGPKINELLLRDGIDTFAKLAVAPVDRVQAILTAAGPNFRLANPASWARQAAMCDRGAWSELRTYQDSLRAGVDASRAARMSEEKWLAAAKEHGFVPRRGGKDDLIIIEGIGPKINELLVAAGIDTFAKLASAPASQVQSILDAAGPNFRLANPASWAQQSAMCDAGRWTELRALQDSLRAGVDTERA